MRLAQSLGTPCVVLQALSKVHREQCDDPKASSQLLVVLMTGSFVHMTL